jgi:Tat protein translocase TatB subunit
MFDISFAELLFVFFVTLVFVAPKNLPLLAKAAGRIFYKAKIFLSSIKDEIERESKFKELKEIEREIKKRSGKL